MFKRAPGQAAASADERPGFVARLRARLNRGASWLSYDLTDLFTGRDIDAAILEELETRLISADVGVEATERILTALRARVARRELTRSEERRVGKECRSGWRASQCKRR